MIRKLTPNEKSINTNSDYIFERNGYKTWLDEKHFQQLKRECNQISPSNPTDDQVIYANQKLVEFVNWVNEYNKANGIFMCIPNSRLGQFNLSQNENR